MTIISPTVPKIWSMADRIFCHFGPFFALLYALTTWKIKILKKMKKPPGYIIPLHMCTINDNHMMHGSWDMEHNGLNFFVILDHFLPFYPPDNPKNQNFEKMKKNPGDIIILHMCTTNYNHIMYYSWDIKHNRQNFLSFWTIF